MEKRYYCIFVDQYSMYILLYKIKNKNKGQQIFHHFHCVLGKHFDTKILTLYTDGGDEYQMFDSYFCSNGIEHLVSSPYILQRFSVVERRHHHLVMTTNTLLHQAALPSNFLLFSCYH